MEEQNSAPKQTREEEIKKALDAMKEEGERDREENGEKAGERGV